MNGEFKNGRHTIVVNNGKIDKVIYNKNLSKPIKFGIVKTKKIVQTKKPSLIKRVGGKIGGWVKNSFIGKSFRAVANVGRKVFNAAKKATGAFLMASHFIGKKVV